ncbi:MAG: alcohol dehydrogenase catalytic domain-containing protein [Candidatus Delongbacteria bacterium]|nr:alcohol dehydrogenase catalytic domain-containing protein [Candidatus Cloacimonadota bacterium]MCB9472628.1 alcohol dehydrogenase catalytic domain-containing protein [Candidatus Delongbacteria bacterium]
MRAARLVNYGKPLEVLNTPRPTAGPDSAVIRVAGCGVCRSDWHLWVGDWAWRMPVQFPRTPGHEIGGVVEEVGGGVRRFRVGQRVTVPFHNGCGECRWCRQGLINLCESYASLGFSYDGGYAEFVHVPVADLNLVALPEEVSLDAAAALGCRYMTAWHGLIDRAGLRFGERLALFGCGGLGLSVLQIAVSCGARVLAVDLDPERRRQALAHGAEAAVDPGAGPVAEAILELSSGGADLSVDALGLQPTCAPALESLRRRGRHLQLGLTGEKERGSLSLPIDRIAKWELSLIGSLGCGLDSYGQLLEQVAAGRLTPDTLIEKRVGLDGASALLEGMSTFETRGLCLIHPGME